MATNVDTPTWTRCLIELDERFSDGTHPESKENTTTAAKIISEDLMSRIRAIEEDSSIGLNKEFSYLDGMFHILIQCYQSNGRLSTSLAHSLKRKLYTYAQDLKNKTRYPHQVMNIFFRCIRYEDSPQLEALRHKLIYLSKNKVLNPSGTCFNTRFSHHLKQNLFRKKTTQIPSGMGFITGGAGIGALSTNRALGAMGIIFGTLCCCYPIADACYRGNYLEKPD